MSAPWGRGTPADHSKCNLCPTSVFWGHSYLPGETTMAASSARLPVILIALLGTSAALAAQRTFDRRLDAPPGGRLTLTTDVGSVAVAGGSARQVIVHAELEGSDTFLERFHISAEQTAEGVTIAAHEEHEWLGWLDWFHFGSPRVRFTVQVPRDYPVDVRTSGGDLDIRDVSAAVRARTSGGGVLVRNVSGSVDASTSGGNVDAEHLDGSTRLSTSGGSIDVGDSTGDLEARTSGGAIRLQNDDGRVYARTSGGSIRAQLRANHGIDLASSGGSITLLLPPGTGASIDARTSGGSVSSAFPLTTTRSVGGNHLVGQIAGGGAPITLNTSGGDIEIAPAN
jgi:Toastrack DUF4097